MKQLTPKDTEQPYFVALMKLLTVFQIKNSSMCILFTFMNTCKEHRDHISVLNLWAMHEHLT